MFNYFFTRFEEHNCSAGIFDKKNVTNYLKMININKSPGPDGICGRTLKFFADQLSGVFQHLFQTSLDTAIIPTVWKTSTVIPIRKTNNLKQLNDYGPVALTSLAMKTMEKLIKSLIVPITESQLDPLQFAYRAGRGVEDAELFILDKVYTHLEKPTAHAKILFADFSSAFNLMRPHILSQKLIYDFNPGNQLVAWIFDFLSCRRQCVFVNGKCSVMRLTHTGSPQGCCLSPLVH